LGQILFLLYLAIQRFLFKNRINKIINDANLICINKHDFELVDSVNSNKVCLALQEINPAVVIVNGTRILSEKVLRSCNACFLNIHAGMTPMYRGVHGGYWALAKNDLANCGVTVHLVDKGVDTGGVLYQARIEPTSEDCFATYPYLQLIAGIPLLMQAIRDARDGNLRVHPSRGASKLYYHPTLWGYFVRRWRSGVR
jgi:folate-dependent phosphoribosylglycinamide formyltransferase PurN